MNLEDIKNLWIIFTGIITSIGAGLFWIMGLRNEVTRLKEQHFDHYREYEKQREEHDKKEAIMWAKIDLMQQMLYEALQSLARLEGRLESQRSRDVPKQ